MKAFTHFFRGLVASFSSQALIAVGWSFAAVLALGLVFTLVVYRFVAATVDHSAMAAELRGGQGAAWAVDLIGRPGTWASLTSIGTVAMVLVPVYLVLVVFFSGGVVSKVRAALGLAGPERFLAASARHAGPMIRVASVEIVAVAIIAVIVLIGIGAAASATLGHWVAWVTLAVSLFVLALVTSVFDYARIFVVARDDGRALKAVKEAFRFVGHQPIDYVLLAVLNGLVALVVTCALVWLHGVVPLDTGPGLALGVLVGQLGVAGRLWARVAAYSTESSLVEQPVDSDVV